VNTGLVLSPCRLLRRHPQKPTTTLSRYTDILSWPPQYSSASPVQRRLQSAPDTSNWSMFFSSLHQHSFLFCTRRQQEQEQQAADGKKNRENISVARGGEPSHNAGVQRQNAVECMQYRGAGKLAGQVVYAGETVYGRPREALLGSRGQHSSPRQQRDWNFRRIFGEVWRKKTRQTMKRQAAPSWLRAPFFGLERTDVLRCCSWLLKTANYKEDTNSHLS